MSNDMRSDELSHVIYDCCRQVDTFMKTYKMIASYCHIGLFKVMGPTRLAAVRV